MPVADLDLELDVFAGAVRPACYVVVLREGVNLAVTARWYRLHRAPRGARRAGPRGGYLEFLVLIAAWSWKLRLLLLQEEADEEEPQPGGGGRGAARADARISPLPRRRLALAELFADGRRYLYRRSRCRPSCAGLARGRPACVLGRPPRSSHRRAAAHAGGRATTSHIRPTVSLERRLGVLRDLLRGEELDFDRQFGDDDRLTQAVTIFALLEQHKRGEATWEQDGVVRPIRISSRFSVLSSQDGEEVADGSAAVGADHRGLLFLAPEPVSVQELVEATDATEARVERALDGLEGTFVDGARGLVLRNVAGGWTLAADPIAEEAARKLLSRPKTLPLTQAQAETLAITATSSPSRDRRSRGSAASPASPPSRPSASAGSSRSQGGPGSAPRSTGPPPVRAGVRPLRLDALPDPSRFDPTPEDEQDLRERLLKAGEQRCVAEASLVDIPGHARSAGDHQRPPTSCANPSQLRQLQRVGLASVNGVRLAKYLAHCGVASRRKAEAMIAAGHVTVAGEVVTDPARDVGRRKGVAVDGEAVRPEPREVWAVKQAAGRRLTAREPGSRGAVTELVRSERRLYPVGRLDADSTGLILLTNDGEPANRLTHPRYGVARTYRATPRGARPARAILGLAAAGRRARRRADAAAGQGAPRRGSAGSSHDPRGTKPLRCGGWRRRSGTRWSPCGAWASARCAWGGWPKARRGGCARPRWSGSGRMPGSGERLRRKQQVRRRSRRQAYD